MVQLIGSYARAGPRRHREGPVRVVLVGMATLGACLWQRPTAPHPVEAEVVAVVQMVFDGLRRRDSALVRPLFHERARLITVTSRGVRIQESADDFVRMIGSPRTEVLNEQLFNVRTRVDGALASVWADYKFYRGTTLNHCGVDHFLLVKQAGAWKILELADTRRTTNCE